MTKRRTFLKEAAMISLGAGLGLESLAQRAPFQKGRVMGLQLFTFFGNIEKDLPGTLKKIKAAGYTEIESAFSPLGGFYGLKAKDFKQLLNDQGLVWASHHAIGAPFKLRPGAKPPVGADGKPITIPPMKNLRENSQEIMDDLAGLSLPYLVCASIPISTEDEVKEAVDILGKSAMQAKKAGMQFAYHNHDAEFKTVGNLTPYDYFLRQLPADTVKMELDIAWCIKGGADPIALFKQHSGRFPLWHVKDLDQNGNVVSAGSGTINYKPIFEAAGAAGMKHFFVEHDFPKDAEASIRESHAYLKTIV